ncbi:Ig-like domain-containing protein [Roseovarius sp. Pro17]|uniref:Ig-like domain-containing protein n=1 Tax=Roseovarius sp. Pro17 TaxID=3108175 RepID=UPI002D77F2F8|nr:Ig-like domain-containing protein [Roseovarius sp. Pro17]
MKDGFERGLTAEDIGPDDAENITEPDFMALEERIMFDGAIGAEAVDAAVDHASDDASEPTATAENIEAAASAMVVPPADRSEIYFVDSSVDDSEGLISAIPDGAEVVVLDAGSDGVEQIASVLEGRTGIDAIHILSHGESDQIRLGDATLDAASIDGGHADELATIGAALSDDADILIYGCDFGQDDAAIAAFARATGADVAASSDATGAADLGGDWILEVNTGGIEAAALSAEGYGGLLAVPEVTAPNNVLNGSEDADLTISSVSVADADGDTLTVTLDVGNGTITLAQTTGLTVTGDGSGAVSVTGDAADINNALLGMTYRAIADYNGSDTLTVTADDGSTFSSDSVAINVSAINDAPTLTPTAISADEGGTTTITEAAFGVFDPDVDPLLNTDPQLAKQLVFKVDASNMPTQGTLRLNGQALLAGSTFSLQDVRDGNLTYVHDGTNVSPGDTDVFAVTINDGGGSGDIGPANVTVNLQPVNDAPSIGGSPEVFEGEGNEDEFGNPGTVTAAADIGGSLTISDVDDTIAASQITITNINNDGEGTLFWDANGNGRLDAGEALSGGETFAASELANGRLRFAHNGNEPDGTSPSFDIEVTDSGGGAGIANALSSGPQTIDITVNPNNDNPELTTNSSVTITAGGGDTVSIDNTMLQATDDDTGIQSIVYTVTQVPIKGELRLDGEVLGMGARFTQADIDSGRLDYNRTESFVDGDTDTFRFDVRDSTQRAFNNPGVEGADRNPDGTIREHTFTIDFSLNEAIGTPPGPAAPGRSGIVEVGSSTSTGVTVTEDDGVAGGIDTTTITSAELQYNLQTNDGSGGTLVVPAAETVYRITSAPGNGTLLLSGSALGDFDTFTQADIDAGNLQFVHDGSETHQGGFQFSVTVGTDAEFAGAFTLNAIPTNDAPTVTTSDPGLFPEGGTIRITASEIVLRDVDTANEPGEPSGEARVDDLMFRITSLPATGTLERFDGTNWVAVTSDDLLSSDLLTTSVDGETSGLRYIHDGSENFADSFNVEVRDDLTFASAFDAQSQSGVGAAAPNNLSSTATVDLTMAPQNDAPIAPQGPSDPDTTIIDANGVSQTTANDPLYLAEGDTGTINDTLLKTVDPDNTDTETLQYRLTGSPANGTLMLNGGGLGVGSTFTQADIDAGRVTYEHDGTENFSDQFMFVVSDSVNDHVYAPEGAAGESTFEIFVNAGRNDAPEIVNNGDSTVNVFGTFTHNFGNDLIIADEDLAIIDAAAGEIDFIQATIVLKDSSGNNVDLSGTGGITLGSLTGLTLIDSDDSNGDLVVQGTLADVQAALTGLEIELPNVDHNDTFTLDVTVDDRLRDGSGTLTGGANGGAANEDGTPVNAVNNSDTLSVTFRASDDNDDPVATAIPGDQMVNEDTVLDLSGYVIDDVDAFGSDLTVTLNVTNGHLSVTGDATTGDPSTLMLTGTVDEVNAQLSQLTYIADADFHSPDGTTRVNDDTLTITVNDGGNSGTGGGTDVALTPTQIAINPVNDAPTVTVPGTQTMSSGVSITIGGVDAPVVGDPQDANNLPFNDVQQLTVRVPAGTGTLTGSGASGLPDLSPLTPHETTFVGTLAELNAELDGLTFTPTDPNADSTVTVEVEIDDLANGGVALPNGVGLALTASDNFDIQISGVNDAPEIRTLTDQTVLEDTSLTYSSGNGNAFTIFDSDQFGADMVATVSVNYGVVTAASGSGATLTGDGSTTLTITGTQSEINAALDGLVYAPDADFHTDGTGISDTITVTIDDLGNTGTGGPLSDSQTAAINITPVNDRPIASGGPVDVTASGEDQTGTSQTLSGLLSGNYSDATDDQTPTGGDTSTPLSFVAIVGSTGYDPAQGTWQVSDGSGGWIDVPASGLNVGNALIVEASRDIRFVPASDFHGTPGTLDVRLADGDSIDTITASTGAGDLKDLSTEGGTGQTGRWSAGSVTIQTTVTPENDAPTGSDTTLAAIDEDNITPSGDTVSNLFTGGYDDSTDDQTSIPGGGDTSTPLGGIAIISSAANAATEGTWQYRQDGAVGWTDVPQGAGDDTSATLLSNNAELRFVPVGDFNGTPGELIVRVADAPQSYSASTNISGVVGDDSSRDTDIWSALINLNTSVTPRNDAPVIGGTGASVTVSESSDPNGGTTPQQLVTGATVSDLDIATTAGLGQFGAGTITVSMDGGGQSFDQLTITNSGLAGIASVSGGSNGADLVVTLATTASTSQVEAIVEALRYNSNSDTFGGTRNITITLSDGNNDNGGGNDAGGPTALTDSLSASVTITEVNDPPAGADNTVSTLEDTAFVFGAGDFNFTQPGGETDVMDGVRIDTLPATGTLALNGIPVSVGDIIPQGDITGGNLTYTPALDANGTGLASFTFSVRDDRGGFDTTPKTMTVDVTPVNDAPSASPSQNFTVGEDDGTQTVTGFMQSIEEGGAADEDGQVVSFSIKSVSDGINFSAAQLFDTLPVFTTASGAGNTLVFAPSDILAHGESETVTVTVGVTDDGGTANGGIDTGADQTFTITITGANDQPVVDTPLPDQSDNDSDTISVDVSGNFSDPDGSDTLSFSATGLPPGLSIDPGTGVISGTIDADASVSGPYTVTVTADDGHGLPNSSQSDSFVWTVGNPAPVAVDDIDSTDEDTAISRDAASGVLPNDSDPDGDALAVSQVDGAAGNVGAAVAGSSGGLFTINADGSYDFDPNGEYESLAPGESATSSVSYEVSDGEGGFDTATLTITITGANDQPVVDTPLPDQSDNDSDTISVDVSGNFSDPDGSDTLSFSATGLPPGLSIDPGTGVISGTIDADASVSGPYTVTVTADDGHGLPNSSQSDSFVWTVGNPAPVAVDDIDSTDEDTAISRDAASGVLPNDSDPDGDALAVSQVDGAAGNVGAAVAGSSGGLFTINADGSYDFDPNGEYESLAPGESATSSVSYEVSDGEGGFDTATLTITITGANDQPVVDTPLPDQSDNDSDTISVDVSGNFSDPDGSDTLSFSATGLPPGLSIDPGTGVISGTIDADASVSGPYTVTVTADDGHGLPNSSQSDSFVWTVGNPAPVAVDDIDSTDEDTAISRDAASGVLPNDSDPDGDALAVSQVDGAAGNVGAAVAGSSGGLFTINADGSYDFDPNGEYESLAPGESATSSVSYEVSDGEGGFDTATLTITITGANDQPVVDTPLPDQSDNDSDTISVDVSGNFSDPDGSDTLSFSATGLPPGLSIDPGTGVISGTIDADASVSGPYTVTVTADDGHGLPNSSQSDSFVWTVGNPAPVAVDDIDSTDEDTAISRDAASGVLPNDSDPDGDALAVSQVDGAAGNVGAAVAGSSGGLFTINADGSYDFDPNGEYESLAPGESATSSVSYEVSDGEGGFDTATLTITITGANDQPVVDTPLPDQSDNDSDTISVDVSGNFSDPDGSDTLSFSATGLPPGLSIDPGTGVISGTIDADASVSGPYTVTVTADDGHGLPNSSQSDSFVWTVGNPAPVAVDDIDSTDEDTAISRDAASGVLPNDSDPDGDALAVSQVDGAAGNVGAAVAGSSGGLFTINADGSYDFDPNGEYESLAPGESATSSVSYEVSDGEGGFDTATLTITITGANDQPVVDTPLPDQSDNDSDTISVDVSGNFSDPDGSDTLSFSATGLPPGLSIDPGTGVISGTIDADASVSGPYTVTVTADDGHGLPNSSQSDSFVWTVGNPAPVAVDDIDSTDEDTAISRDAASGVLPNDSDPDGDALAVSQVDGAAGNVGAAVAGSSGGLFTINADGSYDFDPNGEYESLAPGESATSSVSYEVSDGEGGFDTATLTITITGANDQPVVDTPLPDQSDNDSDTISVDVSGNFSDPDGSDTLSFSATGLPPGLSIDPGTGVISGTIDADASVSGPYTVTVTADDGHGLPNSSQSDSFVWTVGNPAPVAVDDIDSTDEDTAISRDAASGVLPNDSDPDGDALAVSQVDGAAGNVGAAVAGSSGGLFTINADGSYDFDPNGEYESLAPGESATSSVSYEVSDGEGGFDTATLTITITGANDQPVVDTPLPDQSDNDSDTISVDVSGNFSDPDGSDTLSFSATGLPPGLSIDPGTGVISGTIDADASVSGPYTVTVTADDGHGLPNSSQSDSFVWTVGNPAPVAVDDAYVVDEDRTLTVPGPGVLGNDADADGDTLSVAVATGPSNGSLTLNPDGSFIYVPNRNFNGTDSFTYTVTDADGATDTATVTIIVNPVGEFSGNVERPVDDERTEIDGLPLAGIYADPIVDLVAGQESDLFSTPALMSDINTGLGVDHPILTAVNAIQSLDGTPLLAAEARSGVETIFAQGVVATAVDGVGFAPIFADGVFAMRDFNDRLERLSEEGQRIHLADVTTPRGDRLQIAANVSDGGRVVLHGFAQNAAGLPLAIETIEVIDSHGVSVEFGGGGGGGGGGDGDGGAVLAIDTWRDRSSIEFGLSNGHTVSIEIDLPRTDNVPGIGLNVREVLDTTFTAQTEKLVFASDAEASRLIQAVARVTT